MRKNLVGWFLPRTLEARAIWFDPARYSWEPSGERQSNLSLTCPAQKSFSENLYVIASPFDIHLRCDVSGDRCEISVGDQSSIKPEVLSAFIKVHPKSEWRETNKPLFQIGLNYYFLSDDDTDIQYLSPLTTTFFEPPLPGLVLQGRWNIRSWIRPVNFVFEWWNASSDLIIKRGQPILNVMFHPSDIGARTVLVEAEETAEVIAMAKRVENVNSYIRNVFSVLPSVLRHRPKKLLVPCRK